MKCKTCNVKTKVIDTREKESSKARVLVLRNLKVFRNQDDINFRWRHRLCPQCKKVSYSIECDIEDLRNLFERKNEDDKS